jgi:hypothetical protein
MRTRGMRIFLILCTVIVILLTNSSLAIAQPQYGYHTQGLFFNLQFVMTISWGANETQTPIHPGEVRQVHLIVAHTVARGALGRMLLRLLEGRPFPIRLSIEDKPDWCTAHLSVENFIGVITPDEVQSINSVLFIQLSEDAPLNYTLGYVNLHGVIDDMKGPFNILTLIQGYESNVTLFFVTSP